MQAQRDPDDPEIAIIGAFAGNSSNDIISFFGSKCFNESSEKIC